MPNYALTNLEDFLAGHPMQVVPLIDREAPLAEDCESQIEVLLKGKSIATVELPDCTKLVIFHPTVQTHKKVLAFEGENVNLSIEDTNGVFSPRCPQRIVSHVYERGNDTMIVTTEDQL